MEPQAQPTNEPNVEPTESTGAPETSEQPQTEAAVSQSTPAEESSQPEETESDDLYGFNEPTVPLSPPSAPQTGLDVNTLPKDEYGNVDANAFIGALQRELARTQQTAVEQARQEVIATLQEQKNWEKAFDKYPELRENKELRNLVHQQRAGAIVSGKQATPIQAAEALFKHFKQVSEQARVEATESTRVQASAHLESSSVQSKANTGADTKELVERAGSRDRAESEAAVNAILDKWMKDGTIKINR